MRNHPVRKFFGLFILYSALIVGIFVIQFKTESVISRTIGGLRLSMAQTETESNIMELRNQLQVNFKGISFSFDDANPVMAVKSDGSKTPLVLSSWEEGENSAEFSFTDGSTLKFSVSGSSAPSDLFVTAEPAKGFNAITVPYKTLSSYSVDSRTSDRIVLSAKDSLYLFTAPEFDDGRVVFTGSSGASFTSYDPTKHFTFDMAATLTGADEATYLAQIKAARNATVSKTAQLFNSADVDSLSEKQIVAYVAEMAFNARYGEALDAVPDSFKRGNKRTYISSPYFDNLVNMNKSLVMQTERFSSMVDSAINSRNLEIFTIDGIADYILRIKRTQKANALLSMPSSILAEEFKPSLSQASALVMLYTRLLSADQDLASKLKPVIEPCLEAITENCKLSEDGTSLELSENGVPAGTEQLVLTGTALMQYGKASSMEDCAKTGRFMITKALAAPQNLDSAVLADIYPVIAQDNLFYPHTVIMGYYGTEAAWAWTCASSISYDIDEEAVVNLNIDFPLGLTHYIILNGIPTFHARIEIQSQMFRSDPRFETYNSSGYVYQSENRTLFLKSRHKSRIELIRLFCDPAYNFERP